MERFRVVICGGGIAAVEALLRLRSLAGDALDITLLAPDDEFRYRPLAVDEPFSRGGVRRYPLSRIALRTGSEWRQDAAEWVDPQAQRLHTAGGDELPYDALLIAVGGRLVMPFKHVTAFDDERADEGYHGLVQDVEGGYTRSVVLIVPEGHAWLLPVYELALMTAERAYGMGEEGLGISDRHARGRAARGARRRGERGGRGTARARACARVYERQPARARRPAGVGRPRWPRAGGRAGSSPSRASRAARCATSRRTRTASSP